MAYDTNAEVMTAPAPNAAALAADAKRGVFPVLGSGLTYDAVTEKISGIVLNFGAPKWWFGALLIGSSFLCVLLFALTVLVFKGIGIWGNNQPVGWAWDITNFVWWIGIGHAGTLISAILLLLKQEWRTSISRFSETMTIFAVMCAGIFPVFHTGRPWVAYWLFPLPNTMGVWPQFRSPLVWDVFAVSTYFTLSVVFWFVGLVPDIATMRDRAKVPIIKKAYGLLSMGWRGSTRHWSRYETVCLLLAGLCTPLVLSVHSIVSMDFAVGIVPGWHTTIFPPYFVAGAVYSGFAMVLTLVLPARKLFKLEDFITMKHIDNMGKVMLATGLIVTYTYTFEPFFGIVYSGNKYEKFLMLNRAFGPYASFYWTLIFCNVITPQFLWWRKIRHNLTLLFIICIIVNIGMWLERFVIIAISLHRDFLPSSWGMFKPTIFDVMTFTGTLGMFLTLMLLFIRAMPIIPMFEIKTSLPMAHAKRLQKADFEEEAGVVKQVKKYPIYGTMAQYETPAALIDATKKALAAGYRVMDAYTPFPIEEVSEAIGFHRHHNKVPLVTLIGGILGGIGGYTLATCAASVWYPLNVAGRPFVPWPMFIPVTFESTVLIAGLSCAIGMFMMNGLPMPYHPVFNVPSFSGVTNDRFFLCIESRDPMYDEDGVTNFLRSTEAMEVTRVDG